MNNDLTDKQTQIFKFIEDFQRENGKSPTFKEIQLHFEFGSLNSVFKHIKALEKKGVIRKSNEARGIELLDRIKDELFSEEQAQRTVPLLGEIPAGSATLEEENVIDRISISDYLINNFDETFLLKVKGDSIDKTGVFEGDIVIVDQKKTPKNGDIVAALVDNESTLKVFHKDSNGLPHFMPNSTNPTHEEVIGNEAYIQGVVVGSFRKY